MRHFNFTAASKIHLNQSSLIYNIVNTAYQSNVEIPELSHLIDSGNISIDSTLVPQSHCCIKIYSDTCSIGEHKYKLHVTSNNENSYLIKSHEVTYFITKDHINLNSKNIEINLLLGPALILNLALNTTFCLHASAFTLKNKVYILMADSGTGKSTIAHYIDKNTDGVRIADDIVPIEIRNNNITVLPNFPQLKLPPELQYQGKPLQKKVVLLFAKKTSKQTKVDKINTIMALKNLIQHSVASKLFAPNLLQSHLDFCYQISQNTLAYQVEYAHTEKSLQDLLSGINEIL